MLLGAAAARRSAVIEMRERGGAGEYNGDQMEEGKAANGDGMMGRYEEQGWHNWEKYRLGFTD